MQTMAEIKNEMLRAGPAYWAAAVPVITKMPVPTIHPTPINIRFVADKVRFNPCSESDAAAIIC